MRATVIHGAGDVRVEDVPDPVLIRLTFVLDKRAKAHGNTLYIPVESIVAGPVEFKLF